MAASEPGDGFVEVADDLAEQGALRRALLRQRVQFALQSESPGD
jgi:hypothetical protein